MKCIATKCGSTLISENPAVLEQVASGHIRHSVDGWKYRLEMNATEFLGLVGSARKGGGLLAAEPTDTDGIDNRNVDGSADFISA